MRTPGRSNGGLREPGRPGRRAAAAAVVGVLAAVAGCTGSGDEATPIPPTAVPSPSEGELGPGWDESPDAPVTPDAGLSDADLVELLRIPATAPAGAEACTPADLTLELGAGDAAMGHRYSAIVATNDSDRACTLRGYPGIGARGEWGSRFLLVASQEAVTGQDDPALASDPPPVTVLPGETAIAPLEWTGELAGAESEWASILVVQPAAGQTPVAVPAVLAEPTSGAVDIGMQTTVRVAWWRAPAGS